MILRQTKTHSSRDTISFPQTRFAHLGPNRCATGFSLIELLVVIAIMAMLIALLIPSLANARRKAKIVVAHHDLRQITIALDAYAMNNKDKFPPTRHGCMVKDFDYPLPVELSSQKYLPKSHGSIPRSHMADVFNPEHTYKYRAPGPGYYNGMFFDSPSKAPLWGKIWVPDDFPTCASEEGAFYNNAEHDQQSPAAYAVWSIGPDPESPKFPRWPNTNRIDDSRFPLQRKCWLLGSGANTLKTNPETGNVLKPGPGLITHFRTREGIVDMSP